LDNEISNTELNDLTKDRIVNTMTHFREIYPDGNLAYSVGNEIFDWNRMVVSNDYVETAFKVARQTDPKALLLYNDVNVFGEGKVDDHDRAVISLVTRLRDEHLVDGVGLQMHLGLPDFKYNFPSPQVFDQLVKAYKNLGIPVYVTEFDMDMSGVPGSPEQKEMFKAKTYQQMLRVAAQNRVDSFLMFGFTGDAAWHPEGLLFDKLYQPEPAFYAVESVLVSALPSQ
jgi:endo-1,4-beta-xylanase